jgi:hypothetical protein
MTKEQLIAKYESLEFIAVQLATDIEDDLYDGERSNQVKKIKEHWNNEANWCRIFIRDLQNLHN